MQIGTDERVDFLKEVRGHADLFSLRGQATVWLDV
jgi:hypothetical protein